MQTWPLHSQKILISSPCIFLIQIFFLITQSDFPTIFFSFQLESLDCLSFSFTILEDMDRNNSPVSDIDPNLNGNLDPFSSESCNWLLVDVASHLEYNFCLNAAMNYISSAFPLKMMDTCYNELQIESFNAKMKISISVLRRKYSLKLIDIINMVMQPLCTIMNKVVYLHSLVFISNAILILPYRY